jgi:rhamnose utilization protein RhaD (predicted bifunctional aldolase and dehydrogenase)
MSNPFQRLLQVSEVIGKNHMLVQATGGNTSLKQGNIMWVKASGTSLECARSDQIFIPLGIKETLLSMKLERDQACVEDSSGKSLRPSIEATLHAVMPHSVVLHTHPVDVIAISMLPCAPDLLARYLTDIPWHYIPYQRPGIPLAIEIAKALSERPADVFILANHGLVVGGISPESAFALQTLVTTRLQRESRSYINPDYPNLLNIISNIDGAYMPSFDIIHSLAVDPWSLELAQLNPAYPDHVVFCEVHPWIMDSSSKVPGIDTKYGFIPGVGVFMLPAATAATEAMLRAQAEVLLRIPRGEVVNLLTAHQCDELLNWDAEKYRQDLYKSF